MYDIPFISMITIDRELPIIDVGQRHCGGESRRWCDGERRWNTDARIRERDESRQDQHLIDTDKFERVTDYEWIALYI